MFSFMARMFSIVTLPSRQTSPAFGVRLVAYGGAPLRGGFALLALARAQFFPVAAEPLLASCATAGGRPCHNAFSVVVGAAQKGLPKQANSTVGFAVPPQEPHRQNSIGAKKKRGRLGYKIRGLRQTRPEGAGKGDRPPAPMRRVYSMIVLF